MSIETTAPGQSDAGDCSPSSLTPERDELWAKHDGLTPKCCAEMIALAGTLERERDCWRGKAVELHKEKEALECKVIALKSMCGAAAVEIEGQWNAHCDGEGYGPSNLMYRLKGQMPPDLYSAFVTHEERSKWMKWLTGGLMNRGLPCPRCGYCGFIEDTDGNLAGECPECHGAAAKISPENDTIHP